MIYCLEDERNIRELIVYTLQSSGYDAIGFSNSKAFFDAVYREKPELVLLDVMLPNENGLSVLKKLKESSATEGIPVIEACACKCKALIRDIPVFKPWLKDGINVHKAKNIDEFERKTKEIITGILPDLTNEAYKVAEERNLINIGKQLKNIYENLISKN